ncbi:MAG: hypothetical protein AB1324_07925 [Candidatus Micrarchaeota archaeon]
MDRKTALFVLFAAFFLAGCLTPTQKIGCCLKENATTDEPDGRGCVLYNDSSDSIIDMIALTNLEADGQKCNETGGTCNVSIPGLPLPYLVPICTEDDILTCRQPDCLAMVCGDFKFKPAIAPGLVTSGDDVSADVPADTQEQSAVQFYKAQCRFLPMDGNLKKILKNSKSAINVFRMGVGGSFDEFEQYRYFFPMSDKFCAVNPPREGELRVDRYINYLNPATLDQYDPITGITYNCIDESDGAPPAPFTYDETATGTRSGTMIQQYNSASYSYSVQLKDKNTYKFATWARLNYPEDAVYYWGFWGAEYDSSSLNKKIDDAFYKKWLSIAHADKIYGLSGADVNTTRAPFECDSTGTECYSGLCSITTYNRAVMLTLPDANGFSQEIVTDCETYVDEYRQTKIVCAPTVDVDITGPTTAPDREYAKVDARTVHMDGPPFLSATGTCGIADSEHLKLFYDWLYAGGGYGFGDPWSDATCGGALSNAYAANPVTATNIGNITNGASSYMYWYNSTAGIWNSSFSEQSQGPPAGGVLFFGDVEPEASYNGKKVIGYGLATPQQVDDLLVVKNCDMVEGTDYEIVQVPDNPSDWGTLKNVFAGYWRQRFSGMNAVNTEDGCGLTRCKLYDDAPTLSCSYFYDFFWTGLPWVINADKQPHPASPATFGAGTSTFVLASEIGIAAKKINRFSETYASQSDATSCTLRGMHAGYYINPSREQDDTNYYIWVTGRTPTYDLLYSKYIVLFYDRGVGKIGECAIDAATGMPKVKTFGWCEPCTTSTLAYQKVSVLDDDEGYIPGGIANVESGGVVDLSPTDKRICQIVDGSEVECANNFISDAADYSFESAADYPGFPRTYPDGSVLKERMGNYMKSGVMPVLDLSDGSNWEEENDEYDFQRLAGSMGASVVIVDTLDNESDAAASAGNISDRSAAVRSRCFGCLTAFHVRGADDNESFANITNTVFSTNFGAKFTIDLITFDYSITAHSSGMAAKEAEILAIDPSANVTVNVSQAVADDIASYSQLVLQGQGKPSMLVGLNLDSNDAYWTESKYPVLFETIVMSQDKLIKSGLIGIIYQPARQNYAPLFGYIGPNNALVDITEAGLLGTQSYGTKNAKFCALQGAMQKMTAAPPVAIFTRTQAVNVSYCQPCTSLEKTQGICGAEALTCDNGLTCTPPAGLSLSQIEGNFRCAEGTVIDDPAGDRCTLCEDMTGTSYSCEFRYSNGTVQTFNGMVSELDSDVFLDYIAGIPKPQKCCLENTDGSRYSYYKRSSGSQINKPIAFSKTGDPQADCGLTADIAAIKEAQSFCAIEIPVKDYDVTCTLS